jgi:hypothetical protein
MKKGGTVRLKERLGGWSRKRKAVFGCGAIVLLLMCGVCGLSVVLQSRSDDTATTQTQTTGTIVTTGRPTSTPKPTNTQRPSRTPIPTNAPMATRTPRSTNTPRPTLTNTATPDPSIIAKEASEFYDKMLAIFSPAEAAGERVAKHAETSRDMVALYRLAQTAADAWDGAQRAILALRPSAPALVEARDLLWTSARRKNDAYKALMRYIDSSKTSDMADFQEKMEDSNRFMFSGMARIIPLLPPGYLDGSSQTSEPTHAPQAEPVGEKLYIVDVPSLLGKDAWEIHGILTATHGEPRVFVEAEGDDFGTMSWLFEVERIIFGFDYLEDGRIDEDVLIVMGAKEDGHTVESVLNAANLVLDSSEYDIRINPMGEMETISLWISRK